MSEWKEYKLGDIIEIVGGGTPKTSVSYYWNGEIPWLSVVDFNNEQKYVYETEKHISFDGLNNSSTKILNKGDIIISARGTVGAMAMIGKEMAFNQSCYGIKARDIVDNHYLYYLLRTSIQELKHNAHGGVFDTITRETFDMIDISLPPLDEQKRIAGVLSSLDDKIDLLNRENATLEALAETLFRHYFIENPNPSWKEGKLGDVCHYVTDKMKTSSLTTISYISTENMLNDKQGVTKASSIPNDIRVTRYGVGDILLSNIRPYFKKIWLADRRGGCSNDVLCIRANEKEFVCFVYYTLRQDDFFDYVMLGSKGCKMPRGDKQHIMNWPICLPNVESLGVFNKSVYLMTQKIKSNQQQIQTLTTKRDTLLPRLMSGEVKIEE